MEKQSKNWDVFFEGLKSIGRPYTHLMPEIPKGSSSKTYKPTYARERARRLRQRA